MRCYYTWLYQFLWYIFLVITKSATCKYMVEVKASLCKLWIFFPGWFYPSWEVYSWLFTLSGDSEGCGFMFEEWRLFWHMSCKKAAYFGTCTENFGGTSLQAHFVIAWIMEYLDHIHYCISWRWMNELEIITFWILCSC